ncbi:MAG: hypothetical protein IPL62_19770 [Caulobacteraceae bacterium]|nr:hypothetical protein [Caulobacteraceae bacterium]
MVSKVAAAMKGEEEGGIEHDHPAGPPAVSLGCSMSRLDRNHGSVQRNLEVDDAFPSVQPAILSKKLFYCSAKDGELRAEIDDCLRDILGAKQLADTHSATLF